MKLGASGSSPIIIPGICKTPFTSEPKIEEAKYLCWPPSYLETKLWLLICYRLKISTNLVIFFSITFLRVPEDTLSIHLNHSFLLGKKYAFSLKVGALQRPTLTVLRFFSQNSICVDLLSVTFGIVIVTSKTTDNVTESTFKKWEILLHILEKKHQHG